MRKLCISLVLSAASLAVAQTAMKMSVDQLIAFVKSSIQQKASDKQLSEYVRKITLTSKLDDRTVETLQGAGAGPKTVAALHDLEEASASLAVAGPAPVIVYKEPAAPSEEEQERVWTQISDAMVNYTANLPNYICAQVTRRFGAPPGRPGAEADFRELDTLTEKLTYFEHHENYEVELRNGSIVHNISHEQVGGARSSGEFGSLSAEIFSPQTATEHGWDHWHTWDGNLMYGFAYRVPTSRSDYHITYDTTGRTIVAGYHGVIYVDKESGKVMHITLQCDDIPRDFPIQDVKLVLDYDWQDISGQRYVLPLKAELTSRDITADSRHLALSKNVIEWHLYKKYETSSTITFDSTPDALPDDKTKEGKSKQPPPIKH